MGYVTPAFTGNHEMLQLTLQLLLTGLAVCAAGWLASAVAASARALIRAGKGRRAEAALRAEAARGITELEQFLRARAARRPAAGDHGPGDAP